MSDVFNTIRKWRKRGRKSPRCTNNWNFGSNKSNELTWGQRGFPSRCFPFCWGFHSLAVLCTGCRGSSWWSWAADRIGQRPPWPLTQQTRWCRYCLSWWCWCHWISPLSSPLPKPNFNNTDWKILCKLMKHHQDPQPEILPEKWNLYLES